jgi:hypothetical protein
MARIRKPTRPPMKEGDQTVDSGGNGLTVCVLLHMARMPEVQGYSGFRWDTGSRSIYKAT